MLCKFYLIFVATEREHCTQILQAAHLFEIGYKRSNDGSETQANGTSDEILPVCLKSSGMISSKMLLRVGHVINSIFVTNNRCQSYSTAMLSSHKHIILSNPCSQEAGFKSTSTPARRNVKFAFSSSSCCFSCLLE